MEHSRATVYLAANTGIHKLGRLWQMPDGELMLSFTQATGPIAGRRFTRSLFATG
ncbi:MAG: hypothetical protein U0992_06855 [Planctomycetaceae bacterium]